MKILLVGMYDTNTVSLAPHVLKSYVCQYDISSKFDIITREFSIFNDSVEFVVNEVNQIRPEVVAFSVYIWNYNEVLEIIKHIDAVCILGGPQVTGIEEELLRENPNVDIIVTGEGEETFKELLEYFYKQRELGEVKGITSRKAKTESRLPLQNLDAIPSPYERILKEYPHLSWISFETSRGCPMSCKFCAWSDSKQMRYFSLERVKQDLDILLDQKHIKRIYLCDSSILVNKERGKQLLQHIIKNSIDKEIIFEFQVEHLDDDVIDLLKLLPNDEFHLGIQSTNPKALSEMGRVFNKKRFEKIYYKLTNNLKARNIVIDLIYGLPGDNIEGYKESLNYAISLPSVKRIITNPLIVLPGSKFYYEMDTLGIKLKDKRSFLLAENATFSQEEMELSKKYSFFTSVVYLNSRLRDCIKSFAQFRSQRFIETIIEFMETLPFDITMGLGYPHMTPSVREDFETRNLVLRNVIEKFDILIDSFNVFSQNRYDNILSDYEDNFIDQYYRLKEFTGLNSIVERRCFS